MSEFYRDGYFLRKASPGWEIREYSEAIDSKGDLIFNTCDENIKNSAELWWMKKSLYWCKKLLKCRERWVESMNQDCDAKNWFQWKISTWIFRLGLSDHRLYRPRTNMTRDGYIAFFRLCYDMGRIDYIQDVTVPLHLYRPNLWAWRKYLITGKEKYRRRYYFWEQFSSDKQNYVKRLSELMKI